MRDQMRGILCGAVIFMTSSYDSRIGRGNPLSRGLGWIFPSWGQTGQVVSLIRDTWDLLCPVSFRISVRLGEFHPANFQTPPRSWSSLFVSSALQSSCCRPVFSYLPSHLFCGRSRRDRALLSLNPSIMLKMYFTWDVIMIGESFCFQTMIHFASKYTTTEPLCKEFAVQLSFLLWLRRVLLNCCPRLRASSHLGDICHLGSRRTGRRAECRGRIQ